MVTLVVEDGTIVAGANSYASVATADLYAGNIGNAAWLTLDPTDQKAQYLIQTQIYMAQAFRMRWKGWKVSNIQVLDWPRIFVDVPDSSSGYGNYPRYYAPTDMPQQIKDAQCILAAKISASGSLAPDLGRVTTSEQIGSLKVTYDENSTPFTIYRDVEMLLGPMFVGSSLNVGIGRS